MAFRTQKPQSVIVRNVAPSDVERPRPFAKDVEYLAKRRKKIRSLYASQWIAIRDRDVVAHSGDFRDVLTRLRQAGIDPATTLVEFIPPITEDLTF